MGIIWSLHGAVGRLAVWWLASAFTDCSSYFLTRHKQRSAATTVSAKWQVKMVKPWSTESSLLPYGSFKRFMPAIKGIHLRTTSLDRKLGSVQGSIRARNKEFCYWNIVIGTLITIQILSNPKLMSIKKRFRTDLILVIGKQLVDLQWMICNEIQNEV